MPSSFTQLSYHIVFSTKNRQPFLTKELRPRVYDYMGGIVRGQGGVLCGIGGIEDHVHLLAQIKPDQAVSDFLRVVKGDSSRWMHEERIPGLESFGWQDGYGAFSVSKSQEVRVKRYIENQEKHHEKRSSRSEFIALLGAHGVDFKEEFLQ
jgi:putative transposase